MTTREAVAFVRERITARPVLLMGGHHKRAGMPSRYANAIIVMGRNRVSMDLRIVP